MTDHSIGYCSLIVFQSSKKICVTVIVALIVIIYCAEHCQLCCDQLLVSLSCVLFIHQFLLYLLIMCYGNDAVLPASRGRFTKNLSNKNGNSRV